MALVYMVGHKFADMGLNKFWGMAAFFRKRDHLTPKNEYNLFYHKFDAKYFHV